MSSTRTQGLWRATAVMTAGTALSRATGLLRVVALAYALGVTGTRLADTYQLANTTPNIIYELALGGIFTAVFVPVLVEIRSARDRDPSALVTMSLLALAATSALAALGAPLIMQIYTFRVPDPEIRRQQLELATFLLRWFAPQIFFYGVAAIAQALMNVRDRFGPPMFAPILNNVIVSGTLFVFARLFSEQGLDLSTGAKTLLGAGTTAGVIAQAIVLIGAFRGEGLRFSPRLDEAVRRVLRLSVYVVGYVAVNQIGLAVVLSLANGVRGGVTAYQIAFMFFQLPHGLFAVSLITALLPALSRAASADALDTYRRRFADGVRGVAFLLLPAAIGYFILAEPVTRLLLAHGVAGVDDAAAVANVLRAFSVGLVFFSTFQLLTRCFYAFTDTKTPTMLNAAAVAINIAVAFPLFWWLGIPGLGLAHAIAYGVGAVMLLVALSRRTDGLGLRSLASPIGRIAVSAGAMGVAVWGVQRLLAVPDWLGVGVSVGLGAMLYLAFSLVTGVDERKIVLSAFGLQRRANTPGDEQRKDIR